MRPGVYADMSVHMSTHYDMATERARARRVCRCLQIGTGPRRLPSACSGILKSRFEAYVDSGAEDATVHRHRTAGGTYIHRTCIATYSTHTAHTQRVFIACACPQAFPCIWPCIYPRPNFFGRQMSMHTSVHMPTPTCLRTCLCTCLCTCLYAHHRCCIDVLLQRSHRVGLVIADMLARMSGHKCAHYVGL